MIAGKTKKHLFSYKILTFAVCFLVVVFVSTALVLTFLPKQDKNESGYVLAVVSQNSPATQRQSSILLTNLAQENSINGIVLPQSSFFDCASIGKTSFVNVQINNIASSFCVDLQLKNYEPDLQICFFLGKNFGSQSECVDYFFEQSTQQIETSLIFANNGSFSFYVEQNDFVKGALFLVGEQPNNISFDLSAKINQSPKPQTLLDFDHKYVLPYSASLLIGEQQTQLSFDKQVALPTSGQAEQNSNWQIFADHQNLSVETFDDKIDTTRFLPSHIAFLANQNSTPQEVQNGYQYIFELCEYNPAKFVQAKYYFENNMQEVIDAVTQNSNLILRLHRYIVSNKTIESALGKNFFDSLSSPLQSSQNFDTETLVWFDICKDVVASKIEQAVLSGIVDASTVEQYCPVSHKDLVLFQYQSNAQNLFDLFNRIQLENFDVTYSFLKDGNSRVDFFANTIESEYLFDTITLNGNIDIESINLCNAKCKAFVIENNENFVSFDGVIFDKDAKNLLYFPEYASFNWLKLPSCVETISSNAFAGAKYLQKITITKSQLNKQNVDAILAGHIQNVEILAPQDVLQTEQAQRLLASGLWVTTQS